jgi:hypothetical protein
MPCLRIKFFCFCSYKKEKPNRTGKMMNLISCREKGKLGVSASSTRYTKEIRNNRKPLLSFIGFKELEIDGCTAPQTFDSAGSPSQTSRKEYTAQVANVIEEKKKKKKRLFSNL